eukprot:TRINITY_DN22688_c0_g1_i1.p1 TRINITY_DN22688_c0_g1~~TRINITY_DN22688_c0_g1_i1.p1  ORF type:complete len:155 (+),score=21.95 TRINITY_DN22688_c0_g1_i1:40-465(+)
MNEFKVKKTEAEWKETLTEQEYDVLRNGATDPAHKGKYTNILPATGYFACKGCSVALYSASSKFESQCGWPAFNKTYTGTVGAVPLPGKSHQEIICTNCGGHLGHVFQNKSTNSERHCVNSSSITYLDESPPDLTENTLTK